MAKDSEKGVGERKGKGGKAALIACMVVIIALLVIVVALLFKNNDSKEIPRRDVVVNEENAEKMASDMIEQPKTPVGSYEVTMNVTWNFENGKSASDNAYVGNAESNTNSVYFDIIRSDTNETIYASPILPVGTYLDDITLDEELPAGTYDCICTYHLIDENEAPISKVNVSLQIVVRN